MGYSTQNLIANSPVFQDKVTMALTSLVNTALNSSNPKHVAMAKVVMQDVRRFSNDLTKLLAIGGLDLDSNDAAIDAALASNIKWLIAKTGK